MGIESDQVVYEYLGRVGDVAQQRQLPSAARMRLVAELRDEIDRRRAKAVVDSPAAVRRIITRLGTPTEVVSAVEPTPGDEPAPQAAAVPVQREKREPRPRPVDVPSPPHRAGMDELGDSSAQPDWWRVDSSPFGAGDEVPGFVGGVEIPELLKRPPAAEQDDPVPPAEEEPTASPRRRLPRLPSRRWSNPLLLLAAVLLIVGIVIDWRALVLGWLIVYASRRLTRAEIKWAVAIIPGLALAGGGVWLWGRTRGRWGADIPEGQMNAAMAETWPWVIRAAALATAAFLIWRSQRDR